MILIKLTILLTFKCILPHHHHQILVPIHCGLASGLIWIHMHPGLGATDLQTSRICSLKFVTMAPILQSSHNFGIHLILLGSQISHLHFILSHHHRPFALSLHPQDSLMKLEMLLRTLIYFDEL